jgi:hypothetical protein
VVVIVAMWFVGLSLGAALVIHPALGSGVRDTDDVHGRAVRRGSSVSIVGSGGFETDTDAFFRLSGSRVGWGTGASSPTRAAGSTSTS